MTVLALAAAHPLSDLSTMAHTFAGGLASHLGGGSAEVVGSARPRPGAALLPSPDVPTCYLDNSWWCPYYWKDRRDELTTQTIQHIWLTVVSVTLGFLLAFPLGLVARRYPKIESGIIGATTVVYTIPSLALFSLLLPWTGLTQQTVIIGLALYSLTILVRNVVAGLHGVPDDVREAAVGNGYGPTRLLLLIELPLALPVIMAGLRVATVSTVALVTVGAIVSYGGLGKLLLEAVDTQFKAQILAASLLCVVLAVMFDLVLVGVQWVLTPWTHASRGA